MSYLPSIVLAAAGFLLLAVLVIRLFRVLRRFRSTMSMVVTDTNDRAGLVRARAAGVRYGLAQRRHRTPENQ
ncbi:hypothetical protein FPZ12_037510 [Amycolatopsis acidicola]|uniref:Uncharacterized protein n=1 Tax=Amycolatopsis acidicola TaxID=2596893 RepID=A0A5N0UPK9_9PSEU|nr:bacteriophage holin [Amycolatopsis acidicola]KAA9152186.1 hypothetical protein FPZ12_037510 [Amycolatopsis acidicola]